MRKAMPAARCRAAARKNPPTRAAIVCAPARRAHALLVIAFPSCWFGRAAQPETAGAVGVGGRDWDDGEGDVAGVGGAGGTRRRAGDSLAAMLHAQP